MPTQPFSPDHEVENLTFQYGVTVRFLCTDIKFYHSLMMQNSKILLLQPIVMLLPESEAISARTTNV